MSNHSTAKLGDELLKPRDCSDTLTEAQVLIEQMAKTLQPGAATQLVGLSATSTSSDRVASWGHSKRNARYGRFPNIMGGTYTWGGSRAVRATQ